MKKEKIMANVDYWFVNRSNKIVKGQVTENSIEEMNSYGWGNMRVLQPTGRYSRYFVYDRELFASEKTLKAYLRQQLTIDLKAIYSKAKAIAVKIKELQ